MKIEQYYRRQKCSPMTLVFGDIRRMRLFAGFLWAGASNESGVVDDGSVWRFGWLLLRNFRQAILRGNMLPRVGL